MRLLALLLVLPVLALAQPATEGADPAATPPARPAAELGARDAIILGLVEGITEYLPISSTGHLIIANSLLGLDSERTLTDAKGQPLWYRPPSPKNPDGEPMTVKVAADAYAVVIQFGAIAAVALLYWREFVSMGRGVLGQDRDGRRMLINLVIAFVPAAVVGLLTHDFIEERLFSIPAVLAALIGGAALMIYAERWRRRRVDAGLRYRLTTELTVVNSLAIGLMQCASLWPGMSRSMTCIVGGFFVGLDPRRSAEFSFLLGFITLAAATAYKSLQSGRAMIAVFGWSDVLLGAVVATVAAALAVRFLVAFLNRHGLVVFAVYRLILALALVLWYFRAAA